MNNTEPTLHPTLDYSALIEKIDSEIGHISALVDVRLAALKDIMNQKVDYITADSRKDLDNMADRLQESVQEMRNYKDILQQQLVLLDAAVKSAHQRLDNLQSETDSFLSSGSEAFKRQTAITDKTLKDMQDQIDAIQNQHENEALLSKAKKENPLRVFFTEQIVKKYAALLIGSIISYLLLNLKSVVDFLARLFKE